MSDVDSVFVAVADSPAKVGEWLGQVAGCEVMAVDGEAVRLRVRAATVDGWLGVVAQPNGYVEVDPEPDEISGLDAYGIEIQVRGGRSEEVLHAETRLIFDKLVADRSNLPMLLVHNLDTLVAAHLPGVGTHTFDQLISPDAPDIDVWRPWVIS